MNVYNRLYLLNKNVLVANGWKKDMTSQTRLTVAVSDQWAIFIYK